MIFSVKKLRDDLDYWIFIHIGNDIVDFRYQRLEYYHLVAKAEQNGVEDIPKWVLKQLDHELKLNWFNRPTFWHLVKLNFKRIMRII